VGDEDFCFTYGDGVSDLLEAALLAKEAGLLRPLEGRLELNIVPLFETIADTMVDAFKRRADAVYGQAAG